MFRIALLISCVLPGVAFAQTGANSEWSAAAPVPVAAAPVEGMTNDDVVRMVITGVSEDLIMAQVSTQPPAFDTTSTGLITLSTAGVPQRIIVAIIGRNSAKPARPAPGSRELISALSKDSPDPLVPHVPGVYLINPSGYIGKMKPVDPVYAELRGGSGLMSFATVGILGGVGEARIKGANAQIRTTHRSPIFYIYFDESVPEHLRTAAPTIWAAGGGAQISTPQDLQLVRFDPKKKYRKARVGKKLKEKHEIQFTTEMLAPGIYRLTVRSHLAPGEYGLVQSLRSNDGKNNAGRVFDFEVSK
jgi:hypothetical protein